MFNKIISISTGIVVLIALILFQSGVFAGGKISPGINNKMDISHYKQIAVEEKEVETVFRAVGTIRSRNSINIMPRIIARILDIKVRSGDSVKKGDILATLDAQDLRAVLSQSEEQLKAVSIGISMAEEQINAANAAFTLAQKEYDRTKALFDQGAISKKQLDEADTALKQANAARLQALQQKQSSTAQAAAASHSVKQANVGYEYATILSPIDGVVAERISDPGDMANPSFAMLKIFDPKAMDLEIPVPESLIGEVGLGTKVTYRVDSLQKEFTGVIKEIVPSVNVQTRTFLAKILIDKPEKLVPGMFGTVLIPLKTTRKELLIPENIIIKTGQIESVIENIDGSPLRRQIKTLPSTASELNGYRQVISGISSKSILLVEKSKL